MTGRMYIVNANGRYLTTDQRGHRWTRLQARKFARRVSGAAMRGSWL